MFGVTSSILEIFRSFEAVTSLINLASASHAAYQSFFPQFVLISWFFSCFHFRISIVGPFDHSKTFEKIDCVDVINLV